jgi:hypothetical protein
MCVITICLDGAPVSYRGCVSYRLLSMAVAKIVNCDLAGEGVISTDRFARADQVDRPGPRG